MHVYEDLLNGKSSASVAITNDECTLDIACNAAHLVDDVTRNDANLPDSPTLQEALAGPKHDAWYAAILEELAAIKDADTWTLVKCTPNICNIVGCCFVLQKKHGTNGEVTWFKACLIAQGFSQ